MKNIYAIFSQSMASLFFFTAVFFSSSAVLAQAPTVPSSNLTFTNIDGDRFIARYTSGNGQNRIIIASESPITAVPVDGADYLAGNFGQGNEISPGQFVVYKGSTNATWLYGFNHSTTYHIRIYEYNGSNFTTQYLKDQFLEGTVTTLTGPTVQASDLTFTNVTGNAMTLNWTKGDGTSRMIVARIDTPVDAEPTDLTNYGASSSFGSGNQITPGNYVIYNGTGTSMNLSNLAPNKTYHFSIFEYNGGDGRIYLRPGAIGSQLTASAPSVPATNFSTRSIDGNRFIYDFTRGNGTRRMVIAKKGSPVTAVPVDGQTYTGNDVFGSGMEISSGEFVVYNGTDNARWLYGLEPGSTYHFAVFEYNGTGSETFYLTDPYLTGTGSTLTGPTIQASDLTFANVTGNAMTLNWTKGDGTSRMIVARIDTPVDAEPTDLTNYGASSSFGSGNQITPGNYVIYNGTGTSMNLSNLAPNKTYHFSIFEYNGGDGRIYLRPGAIGSQLTASAPSVPATNFSTRSIDGNRFIYDFTRGNGTRRMVIAKKGSLVTAVPVDGQTYTGNDVFGSGMEIAPSEFVVYNGTDNARWLYGLEPGSTYHFAVFEYNGTGSETFYLTDPYLTGTGSTLTGPTVQASDLTFANVTGNAMTLNWTKGDGTSRMIVARIDTPVDAEPTDLTNYGASSSFGSGNQITPGNYVIYNGTGTSMNLSNLAPNKTYHFSIFEYNGGDGRIYLRPGAIGSQLTASAPSVPATNFSTRSIDGNRFIYDFTRGNGTRRMVIAKKGSPVTSGPVDGQTYTGNDVFGSGMEISPSEFVVYNGTDNARWLYGLEPGSTYHFAVFEYNGTGSETFYLIDPYLAGSGSTISNPTVQSSNAFISSRSNTSINISWTRGDGAQRILIGRKDGPVNVEPQDFTNYSSSATFGTSWTEIGTGNYALYIGGGNNVNITNLQPGTNYNFALFEFNGADGKLYMRPGYAFALATFGERPTVQSSNAGYSNIGFNSFDVSFVKGNGTRRLVLARAGSAVNAGPSDFASYAGRSTFGQGDEIGSGNFVVFNGLEESFSLEGLQPGVTYHLAFFEYAVSEQGELYLAPAYTSTQRTLESYDLALSAVLSPVSSCDLSEAENISVEVSNLSSTPVEAFSLGYSINGASPVIEEVTGEDLIPGNGTFTYTFDQTADFSIEGIYDLKAFLVLGGDVNSGNNELTVPVENFPDPVVSLTGDTTIVAGESLLLEATGGAEYLWSTGETTANITVQPTETKVYTVLITDQNGCFAELSVEVEVLPDPCAGLECPPGTACFDGQCIPVVYSIVGTVRDAETNSPLQGVLVASEGKVGSGGDIFTDDQGNYSIEVDYNSLISFTKLGYEVFTSAPVLEEISPLDILLQPSDDPCAGFICPIGFFCFNGSCFPEPLTLSGYVIDAETSEAISGVEVSTDFETVQTDETGFYSLQVTTGDKVVFSKAGYIDFETAGIVEDNLNYTVELEVDVCSLITCPPGFGCLNGGCYPIAYSVRGTVRDAETNEPIAGVQVDSEGRVFNLDQEDILTDAQGNFEILVDYNSLITFSKLGYLVYSSEPILEDTDSLDVLLQPSDLCGGLCPPGTQCYQGGCYSFTISVSGIVRDAETNLPLFGVRVGWYESSVLTDVNGFYTITMSSRETLTFSKSGYNFFTSEPINESTNSLDVLLSIDQLCEGVTCPPGFSCHQGMCLENSYRIRGTVRDAETNEPIAGVRVDSEGRVFILDQEDILTDAEGNFEIVVDYNAIITFSKLGYLVFSSEPILEETDSLDVLLQPSNLCGGLCPPGTQCVQGMCVPFSISVSGIVRDSETNLPLSGVRVGWYESFVLTDVNGFYTITLSSREKLSFSKSGYLFYSSEPILESTDSLDVLLSIDQLCEGVTCPPGMQCYQGGCFSDVSPITVSGKVTDRNGGEPISGVLVTDGLTDTVTDANGDFSITISSWSKLTFSREGYDEIVTDQILESASNFNLSMNRSCLDFVYCGLGTSCVSGECKFNCLTDSDCPPGTICVGNGVCLEYDELCLLSDCPPGSICQLGQCIAPEDPCYDSNCPPGTLCLDGVCIVANDPYFTVSGQVTDARTGLPLSGVEVNRGVGLYPISYTDLNGFYSVKVLFGHEIEFFRWDYVGFTSPPVTLSRSQYNVQLNKNWCLLNTCQPGQVCVDGRCETIFYTVSGTVRDELTNNPIANAIVKTAGAETQTDESGGYTIQVILDNAIQFIKEGYSTLQSPNFTANNLSYDVLLGPDPCEGVSCAPGFKCKDGECIPDLCFGVVCQPGEFCFDGTCFQNFDLTILGTVKDINTGEPIAASAVVNGSPTLVDYNGYFIVTVPYGERILFIADGYKWEYSPFMTEDFATLEILMTPDASCENITCPDGKICNEGVCLDPCEELNCPPGTACFGGQCVPVDCDSSLTALQVSPEIGTSETEYTFTITYTDLLNAKLAVGYPRLELDGNNNGSATDPGDLTFGMSELDPSDLNLTDGKIYKVTVSGLKDNTAWKARVVAQNEFNCQVSTDFIDEPNVSVSNLDVAIFANNISFTNDTPDNNETITIFARVRNISDFPAENFVVSAYDGQTKIFTTIIDNLDARSNIDLSWDYSFAEAGFYQIKVVIDETDVLEEINELNNFAIRPVLVGNYVLPGGIQSTAAPNTTTVFVGDWINISGYASYFGIDEGVNPDVAGANVSISYENGSFQTTTSSNGTFSRSVKMPTTQGIYTFTGSVTDYTLTGEIPSFQVEVIPYPAKADLRASITLDQTEVLAGESITGTATVTNLGELTATNFTFRYSSCEGVIAEVPINSLAPGETLTFDFETSISSNLGSCFNKNNCTFSAIADVFNQVDDKNRTNNSALNRITVYPKLSDLTPSLSSIGSSSRMESPFEFVVKVNNIGGVAADSEFIVNVYVDDELVDSRSFENLNRCGQISYPLAVEFKTQEDHIIRIKVDEPLGSGSISEYREDNNEFVRTVKYSPPPVLRPNLYILNSDLSVLPSLPGEGENFLIKARVRNTGQASIEEGFEVNFQISENGVLRNETVQVPTGLASGEQVLVEYETSLANYGNHSVLVELDPENQIDESSEFDNKASMPLCLDFAAGQTGSVWNGGFFVNTQQNLTGRVRNLGLFTATNVRVDFLLDGSEIGSTIIPELKPSYGGVGQFVSIPYTFREVGTFQLEMVIDRNEAYIECDEANNSTSRSIIVRAPQPDLRILSEYISPTNLNPDLDEEINLFVSFENIGSNTLSPFKIRVTVDDVQLGQDILVESLGAGQLATVPVETPYSSPTAGVKVVRGFVDIDQQTDDLNYANNDASRAVVVGEAPNLFFTQIGFSTYCPQVGELIQINVDIENEGDLASNAEVHFYYVTETDTVPIDFVPIFVDIQGAASTSISWTVINPEYTILAEIKNSDPQEFDDLDNFILGEFKDNIPPTVTTQDITVYLDQDGFVGITPEQVDNGSFDECGIAEMTLSQSEFDCTQLGPQTLTFTVRDFSGNESSAEVIVTIEDNEKPTITAPAAVTVSTDTGVCEASGVALGTPETGDNCSVADISNNAPAVFPIGETLVTWTVEDASGNTETATQLVTVEDNEKPTITAPAAVTVSTDTGVCQASEVALGTPETADNCEVADISNDAPAVFPIGETLVTWTIEDASGNTETATQLVTVEDNEKPTITAPAAVTVSTDNGVCQASGVALGTPETADNCEVADISNDAPAVFPIGETLVTWTVEDASGNTETATQLVTVEDNEKPTITAPVAVIVSTDTGVCEASGVALGTPETADNCEVADISNDAPAVFPIGETLVTWTVEDASGNTETATQLVTVEDNEKPTITAPAAVTVSTDNGVCQASEVALGTPVTADNCEVADISNDAPAVFPIGETLVTWTVEDASGNTETATQLVTVEDNEKPTITAPAAVIVSTDTGVCEASGVALGTPVTADNCEVADISNDAPAVFPIGETLVTWTVEDASGNTETATQLVTVEDNEKPTITAPAAVIVSTDTGVCEASGVALGTPVTADNCEVADISNDAPAVFPIGETLVTWTVEDASGNTETATQLVTVEDNEKPTITAPAAVIVSTDTGVCEASGVALGTPVTADNCEVADISNDAPAVFPIGETLVTWTVEDASGNTETATQLVTVEDNEKPTITAPVAVIVSTDTGVCEASGVALGTPETADNCEVADISNDAPAVFPLGETLVTWTVEDASGNTETATQLVTVIDTEKPTITAPEAITVPTDSGVCEASGVDLGTPETADNCSVASVSNDAPAIFPLGETLVTWTVEDASGNTEIATQLVTVEDNEAPIVLTQNIVLQINEGGSATIQSEAVDAGSSDNCGIASTILDKTIFTDSDEGDNEVLLTVTDTSGNSESETAIVTVVVIREPTCVVTAIANDVTVSLDKNGLGSITTKKVDNGSSSTCGRISTLNLSQSVFDCSDLGVVSVTLTAIDVNGNEGTTEFFVTVVDQLAPTIARTPKSLSTTLSEGGSFALPDYRALYPATDNCSIETFVQTPAPKTLINQVGTYPITLTATDFGGNTISSQFDLIVVAEGTKGGGNGGGKGKNKSIDPSGLVQVAWNTPFDELKDYTVLYELEEETVEIMVDWNEKDYDPLVPGIYEISGKVKQLNSNRIIPVSKFSMYVLVMDKPMPLDISLSNQVIGKNQSAGQVIGILETEDPADDFHAYQLDPSADFELEGNQIVWIGVGELRHEYLISVTSTDRLGQSISKEIRITREIGANQVTVYPNPATNETNIKVDLNQANDVIIKVFDSAGRLVFEESGYQERGFIRNLDLQTLSSGLYQVQVQIGFETITKRLVKIE